MTAQDPLEELEEQWEKEKITLEEMIEEFFDYLRDHQQLFARHKTRMLKTETRFRQLEKALEAVEVWMATAKKELAEIRAWLRGWRRGADKL